MPDDATETHDCAVLLKKEDISTCSPKHSQARQDGESYELPSRANRRNLRSRGAPNAAGKGQDFGSDVVDIVRNTEQGISNLIHPSESSESHFGKQGDVSTADHRGPTNRKQSSTRSVNPDEPVRKSSERPVPTAQEVRAELESPQQQYSLSTAESIQPNSAGPPGGSKTDTDQRKQQTHGSERKRRDESYDESLQTQCNKPETFENEHGNQSIRRDGTLTQPTAKCENNNMDAAKLARLGPKQMREEFRTSETVNGSTVDTPAHEKTSSFMTRFVPFASVRRALHPLSENELNSESRFSTPVRSNHQVESRNSNPRFSFNIRGSSVPREVPVTPVLRRCESCNAIACKCARKAIEESLRANEPHQQFMVTRKASIRHKEVSVTTAQVKIGIGLALDSSLVGEIILTSRSSTGPRRALTSDEFYYVTQGFVQCDVGSTRVHLYKGDYLAVPEGVCFEICNRSSFSSKLIFFSPHNQET